LFSENWTSFLPISKLVYKPKREVYKLKTTIGKLSIVREEIFRVFVEKY